MPRPRTPAAKAKATGASQKNKGRFADRNEPPINDDVGPAPDWMTDTPTAMSRTAWEVTRKEVPWLNSSHRGLLEIAASIRGRLMAGQDVGVQALNLLRQALGQMGATPADASKAGARPDGDQTNPADQYFT